MRTLIIFTYVRQPALAPALAALFIGSALLTAPASAQIANWYDNYDDGNATDGTPLAWVEDLGGLFPGRYDASSGDYELQGEFIGDDDESLSSFIFDDIFADTSVRTRAVSLDGGFGAGGNVGPIVRLDPNTLSGYFGLVDTGGNLILDRFDFGVPAELLDFVNIPELGAGEDVVVQLDAFGDEITLSAWRPGDPQPLAQVTLIDDTYSSGPAGILWNADDDQAIGVYRWTKAAGVQLLNGDMDNDGDVDFDDIAGFVLGLNDPGDFPNASDGMKPVMQGDIDADGDNDFDDIGGFVSILTTGSQGALATVPEPTSAALAFLALWGLVAFRRRAAR